MPKGKEKRTITEIVQEAKKQQKLPSLIENLRKDIEKSKMTKDEIREKLNEIPKDQVVECKNIAKEIGIDPTPENIVALYAQERTLEKIAHQEAERTLEKIPLGLNTKGLMSHDTKLECLEQILEEGILSVALQYKKYKKSEIGAGVDVQAIVGYNYVSVWDPYCGAFTQPWHKKVSTEVIDQIRKEFRKFEKEQGRKFIKRLEALTPNSSPPSLFPGSVEFVGIGERYGRRFYIWEQIGTEYIGFGDFWDPKNEPLVKKMNEIFEKVTVVDDKKIPDKDTLQYKEEKLDPLRFFAQRNPDRVTVLINPEVKRFSAVISAYGPESLVKDKIDPNDIVGIVVSEELKNTDRFNGTLKLAQRFGVPLFISKKYATHQSKRFGFELVWPKEEFTKL